jgi:hypothetical protein
MSTGWGATDGASSSLPSTSDDAGSSDAPAAPVADAAHADGTSEDAVTTSESGSDGGGDAAPRPTPVPVSADQLCKLESNLKEGDPTSNQVQDRANVLGADLGIPVEHGGTLFLFFGDTVGYQGIWPAGQGPDSIAYAADPASMVATDPSLLCSDLTFLTLSPQNSIGPTVDPAVQADFAGGYMTPPPGHSISEYVHHPPSSSFPSIPGVFEVPSGNFDYGDSIYLFYTTVQSSSDTTMMASYLAQWGPSSPGGPPVPGGAPGYQILYQVDERFDGSSPLHGHFVNIAGVPSPAGDFLYMFGTGDYRKSFIYLARKPLSDLASPGGYEEYDATSGTWSAAGAQPSPGPIVSDAQYGETSFRYFHAVDRWMMLAASTLGMEARFADRPEGPWSDAILLTTPAFYVEYCCIPDDNCQGKQFLNCDKTGPYGSYLLPEIQVHSDGSFTVAHTLSSFAPYNVALFTATFK